MFDQLASRSQWQDYRLEQAAKSGKFYVHLKLFPSERRRLIKRGFTVVALKQSNNETICLVHFLNTFPQGIPSIVIAYLVGLSNTPPVYTTDAQELFAIAFQKFAL